MGNCLRSQFPCYYYNINIADFVNNVCNLAQKATYLENVSKNALAICYILLS